MLHPQNCSLTLCWIKNAPALPYIVHSQDPPELSITGCYFLCHWLKQGSKPGVLTVALFVFLGNEIIQKSASFRHRCTRSEWITRQKKENRPLSLEALPRNRDHRSTATRNSKDHHLHNHKTRRSSDPMLPSCKSLLPSTISYLRPSFPRHRFASD